MHRRHSFNMSKVSRGQWLVSPPHTDGDGQNISLFAFSFITSGSGGPSALLVRFLEGVPLLRPLFTESDFSPCRLNAAQVG